MRSSESELKMLRKLLRERLKYPFRSRTCAVNWLRESLRFSLVELLVTAAILIILLSLFLPMLRKSMSTVLAIQCQAQLRQWHVAMQSYASDFADYMPVEGVGAATDFRAGLSLYMDVQIINYQSPKGNALRHGPLSVFWCPAAWDEEIFNYPGKNFWLHPWSNRATLGKNACVVKSGGAKTNVSVHGVDRLRDIDNPDRGLLYGDLSSVYHSGSNNSYFKSPDLYSYSISYLIKGPGTRHNGVGNYIFIDGHLQQIEPEILWTAGTGHTWWNIPGRVYYWLKECRETWCGWH